MFRFFIMVLTCANMVFMCKWVCIDKNNNIKKYYFNQSAVKLEIPKHAISIPEVQNHRKRVPIPDVTLKMPEYEVLPVQVSCGSQEFKNSLKGNGKRIKCKPRNTIVDIKSKGAQKITPSKINTRLCSGVCQGNKSCISTQSKNITVAISIVDRFNQGQCSNVMVPADTKCKCGCEMKGSDCLSTQVFDKKFCKCKCTNEVDMNNCLNKMHNSINKYEWNNKSCICQCKLESICSTGTTWDKNECKCTRVK